MNSDFNTDTDALRSRACVNANKARYDLEEWMLPLLPPLQGLQVLDLGCGTGKQVFRLAPLVSGAGRILGIDLSQEAVNAVNQRAKTENLQSVEAQRMALDDCPHRLSDKRFDLIISSYAIYYSQDVVALLKGLRSLLTDRGVVFVCGPGQGTNSEICDMVSGFIHSVSEQCEPPDDFLNSAQIREIAGVYSSFAVSRLENQILFDSPETVLLWWKNHNSFVPSVAAKVESSLRTHFETSNIFPLTKNVLGIRYDA